LFLIVLVAAALIFAVIISFSLTRTIRKLSEATVKVSEGNFDVQIDIRTKDEIENLAQSFLVMSHKIKQLLLATADKVRMEEELKTAKLVQETLFPNNSLKKNRFEIQGMYKSASECSGDWWYYKRKDRFLYFMIGDVTGLGVGAALVTSAARSCAEIIESIDNLSVPELMNILSRGIYAATKGTKHMTYFLGQLNLETYELKFANASHNPPYMVPGSAATIKKEVLQAIQEEDLLLDLGSDREFKYKESSTFLNPGDRLFIYTDGVSELCNRKSEQLSERLFLKFLCQTFESGQNLAEVKEKFDQSLESYRHGMPLADDLIYFFLQVT
jgi:sigma-B regulation protein RsbU (phosphoserine phosphatase)